LRGQMADIALRQAQADTARQNAADIAEQVETRQRSNAAQRKLTDILQIPGNHHKIQSGDISPITEAGIPIEAAAPVVKNLQDIYQKTMDLDKTTAARHLAGRQAWGAGLVDINPDDPNAADQLNSLKLTLGKDYPDLAAQIPQFSQGPNLKSQIENEEKKNGVFTAVLDAHIAREGEQAKIDQSKAAAASSNANAAFEKYKLDLLKGGAVDDTKSAALMDSLFAGKPELRAQADSIYAVGKAAKPLEPGAGVDAVKAFYDEQIGKPQGAAATIRQTTPAKVDEQAALLPGEVRKANAVATAEIPARVEGAVKTQKALAAMSPDAFAGIADASARHTAQTDLDKIATSYTDTAIGAQRLLDTIHAAQSGNKAAPAAVIIEQARSLIGNNRLNQQELKNVSVQAGSLADKIEGWIGKHTEGQPIPADILRDTASLAAITKMAADRSWDAGMNRLKARGADVAKIEKPKIDVGDGMETREYNGATYQRKAGTSDPWTKK